MMSTPTSPQAGSPLRGCSASSGEWSPRRSCALSPPATALGWPASPVARSPAETLRVLAETHGAKLGALLLSDLEQGAPRSVAEARARWPVRQAPHTSSPHDWQAEVLYYVLVDRFSDGREAEAGRPLFVGSPATKEGLAHVLECRRAARMQLDLWRKSGAERYQGGTLLGVLSKLDYLKALGVTTVWLSPVFKQRAEANSYHGFAPQNLLDVDPRFGTRADLVLLVAEAHARGLRVVMDGLFNHSGANWCYGRENPLAPPYRTPDEGPYSTLAPITGTGDVAQAGAPCSNPDDFVYPLELRDPANYVMAGAGSLAAGLDEDDMAQHKRTDVGTLRKYNLDRQETQDLLVACHAYWIALADLDGIRVDTTRHMTSDVARSICAGLREAAELLGKENFLLAAHVPVAQASRGVSGTLTRGLSASVDMGHHRQLLSDVAKGLVPASLFFSSFGLSDVEKQFGTQRALAERNVLMLDDHDNFQGVRARFAADACNDHEAIVGVALLLFTCCIPCLYYGTEQGLASAILPEERPSMAWGTSDVFMREAMFGPEYPRASGRAGQTNRDHFLPGFGVHGTSGFHVFNPEHPLYLRISALTSVRRTFRALRRGRQYQRATCSSERGCPFTTEMPGGALVAWSRVLGDEEALVAINTHSQEPRGALAMVDASLASAHGDVMVVVHCTAPVYVAGEELSVRHGSCGVAWVDLLTRPLPPSEVLILANKPAGQRASAKWLRHNEMISSPPWETSFKEL